MEISPDDSDPYERAFSEAKGALYRLAEWEDSQNGTERGKTVKARREAHIKMLKSVYEGDPEILRFRLGIIEAARPQHR